jgi:predicted HTH domain antitoxin
MTTLRLDLDEQLLSMLPRSGQSVEEALRELAVMDLYRRGEITSGRAAEILEIERIDFIRRAGEQGIPYFDMPDEELEAEVDRLASL